MQTKVLGPSPRIRRLLGGFAVVVCSTVALVDAVASAAPAAPEACSSSGLASHLVVDGDTWSGIADAADVAMSSLVDVNDASADDMLHPGDSVCLPAGATVATSCRPSNAPVHIVRSGDTWWELSTRAGVSMSTLLSVNAATAEKVIRPGDEVCLPPGTDLGSEAESPASTHGATGWEGLQALPMRGPCWFSDSWGDPRGAGRTHVGADLFAAPESHVYAVADGTLTRRAWDQPGLRSGNAWWLTAADSSSTYYFYAHMLGFAPGLEVGSRVQAGQIIGFMGNTGNSAFPHLHFEIHPNGGGPVNPYPVLRDQGGCKTGGGYTQPGGWVAD